jgi:hypothetical protein
MFPEIIDLLSISMHGIFFYLYRIVEALKYVSAWFSLSD